MCKLKMKDMVEYLKDIDLFLRSLSRNTMNIKTDAYEAAIAFQRAIINYDRSKGMTFKSFLYMQIRSVCAHKAKMNFTEKSRYIQLGEWEDGRGEWFFDPNRGICPSTSVIDLTYNEYLLSHLDEERREVLLCLADGYTLREIGATMEKTKSHVANRRDDAVRILRYVHKKERAKALESVTDK